MNWLREPGNEPLPGYTLVDKIGVAGQIAEERYDERL